jgi:hypothetical protein
MIGEESDAESNLHEDAMRSSVASSAIQTPQSKPEQKFDNPFLKKIKNLPPKKPEKESIQSQKLKGANAILNQMHKYSSIKKHTMMNELKNKVANPVVQYLIAISKNNVMPKSMGMVHKKDTINEVDCSNNALSIEYINAIS